MNEEISDTIYNSEWMSKMIELIETLFIYQSHFVWFNLIYVRNFLKYLFICCEWCQLIIVMSSTHHNKRVHKTCLLATWEARPIFFFWKSYQEELWTITVLKTTISKNDDVENEKLNSIKRPPKECLNTKKQK